MAAIPAWFWLVLAAIPVGLAAVLVYYDRDAAVVHWRRRWRLGRRRPTLAVVVWLVVVVAFGLLGDVPGPGEEPGIRSFGSVVLLWSVPLVGGLLGLASQSGSVGCGDGSGTAERRPPTRGRSSGPARRARTRPRSVR